jgi:hypothetical protein
MPEPEKKTFSELAEEKQRGPLAQFLTFVFQNKKWWLTPIVLILVIVGLLAVLGGSGMAPFIYSLF